MEQASDKPTLLTVKEIAAVLQVQPSWVYPHADALGAFRVGKYLRFSLNVCSEETRSRSGRDFPSLIFQPNDLYQTQ